MKHKHFTFVLVLLMSLVAVTMTLVSCSDNEVTESVIPPSSPIITNVSEIGTFYVQIEGTINYESFESVNLSSNIWVVICKSEDFENPITHKAEVIDGKFSIRISQLEPDTKYFYYAICGWEETETSSFTTNKMNEDIAITGDCFDLLAMSVTLGGWANLHEIEIASATATEGVQVSTSPDFSNSRGSTTKEIYSDGSFYVQYTKLKPETKYYYRAFVKLDTSPSQTTFYGDTKSFTTITLDVQYTDLGLPSGTLWAWMNIGASVVEEKGEFFAWAETTSKNRYSWGDYKWSKYTSSGTYGRSELRPEDDAAYVNWGPNWRMPTKNQFLELINPDYTTIENNYVLNDVIGYQITSKINGNSIFLPKSNAREFDGDVKLWNKGPDGGSYNRLFAHDGANYWSRTANGNDYPYFLRLEDTGMVTYAEFWQCDYEWTDYNEWGWILRNRINACYCGLMIRPVRNTE